jgi:DNA invertase Pin-like site-specific DNA recombinase
MEDQTEIDITKLKYALYARKSTEDGERQVRSIPDQIYDCEVLAANLGIKVSKPYIEETKSAKTPDKRPLFTQLLKDVRSKKYDGILCWHPDRLARNMIEAGQIIDMLDNHIIKDLRFVSHQFSNDANGKMLLGMLFVFSKHYSDDLSRKVNRGVKGNFKDGKSSGTPKHGYTRGDDKLYRPNGVNHQIIRTAWDMRSKSIGIQEIVDFLNENDYGRVAKAKSKRTIKASINSMSMMFMDPFYYGLLVQAGQTVDLRELYDFEPVITQEVYDQVQQISYNTTRRNYKLKKRTTFYPLRRFVRCAYCDRFMAVGKSQGRDKSLSPKLYFRCDNKQCQRFSDDIKRNIRSKIVFNWVQDFLDNEFQAIANEYDRYSSLIDGQSDAKRVSIQTKIQSKLGVLRGLRKTLDDRAMAMSHLDPKSTAFKTVSSKLEGLENQVDKLDAEIEELKLKITDRTKLKLSKEQFLNLIKTASDKMRAGDAVQKDRIIRIIFLNLKVGDQKVDSYLCNEPFASMLKLAEISFGRGERT